MLIAGFAGVDVLADLAALRTFVVFKSLRSTTPVGSTDGTARAPHSPGVPAVATELVAVTWRILADSPHTVHSNVGASGADAGALRASILQGAAVTIVAGQRVGCEDASFGCFAGIIGAGVRVVTSEGASPYAAAVDAIVHQGTLLESSHDFSLLL